MSKLCPLIATLPNCSISNSYLRPDAGVAIIPAIFSGPIFFTQLISLFVRVFLDWRNSQLLSHMLAILSIVLIIVALQVHQTQSREYIYLDSSHTCCRCWRNHALDCAHNQREPNLNAGLVREDGGKAGQI